MRAVVLGNSGSGKSTLAKQLGRPHLDLDTIAWLPGVSPPERRPIADSAVELAGFASTHDAWVIEGCYADLAELALPHATRLIFVEPGVDACIANARARLWEPHKYSSRAAQDANLEMLIGWIRAYATRDDACSLAVHRALFERFSGDKVELTSREAIAAYRAA